MPAPEWAEGLDWQCTRCGATYPSQWARDLCTLEDDDAHRDARRR